MRSGASAFWGFEREGGGGGARFLVFVLGGVMYVLVGRYIHTAKL